MIYKESNIYIYTISGGCRPQESTLAVFGTGKCLKNNSHTTENSQGIKHRGLEASLIKILMYGAGGVGQ